MMDRVKFKSGSTRAGGTLDPAHTRVIFLHIPKTAGSTLNWILRRIYPSEKHYNMQWYFHDARLPLEEIEALDEQRKNDIRLFTGHTRFGIHTVVPEPNTYISVLREPTSRVVSGYYNVLRDKNHPLHNDVSGKSIEEYVSSGVAIDVDNGQTRRISGAGMEIPYGKCSRNELELAKWNLLNHFSTIGLTERFDETLILLKKNLSWPMPYYIIQNRGRNKPSQQTLSQAAIEQIKQYNQLDYELYEYAQLRFQQHILEYGSDFQKDLKYFQFLNRYWFKLHILPYRTTAKVKWEIRKLTRRFLK